MFIDNWYQMSADAVIKKLKTDKTKGLERKTVRALLRKHGKNDIYPVSKITFYNVMKAMAIDYTSYLLIATALIAAVFEETVGAWTLVVLVTANLAAMIIAYAKSQRILEGMDRYTLPVVRVIREGRLFMVDQKRLVQGDIICLSRGDIVPADARLISDTDLIVDEASLFGKSFGEQRKLSDIELHETLMPEKQRNMVFASTIVLSGEARAVVTATGEDTIVVFSEHNHPIISHEKLPVLGALQKISRVWSLLMIAAVFFLTLLNFAMPGNEHSLFQSFIKSMSFAVSTMSEMYVAFGYIVLACAVFQTVQTFRESGTGAILKNPLCMEKLRHMTCLIVPREGILTTRDTVADRIFAGDRLCDIADRRSRKAMERPILFSILSTGLYGEQFLRRTKDHIIRTEEEASILSLARSMDIYNVRLDRAYPMLEHRGRDEDSRYETTLVRHRDSLLAVSRGETEAILADCSYYYKDGKIMMLTPEVRSAILIAYRKLIRQAYSVTALASHGTIYDTLKFIGAVQHDMVFEGFVAFRVPYQRGIGQLVAEAEACGVKVIMTSERPAASEVYFAKQLGIVGDREQCVDGSELHKMKEGIRRTNASYYRLYCGLDKAQREELLQYLHEDGEIVGVVGHRLEDLQLLRRADISIAQNISVQSAGKLPTAAHETVLSRVSESAEEEGCEALKFTADILVSDASHDGRGGFGSLLGVLGIAKNTDKNVIRIVKYLLCAQTARFLLVLYTILFSQSGMSAVQTLFAGLIADFMAVMILSFQRPDEEILRKDSDAVSFLQKILHTGLPSFLTGVCWACTGILTAFLCGVTGLAQTEMEYGSILFVTNSILSLLLLLSVQRDEPVIRPGVRMSTLQVLYMLGYVELFLLFFLFPRFGTMFGVAKFDLRAGIVILAFCAVWLTLAECIKALSSIREKRPSDAVSEEAEERRAENLALFRLLKSQKEAEEGTAAPVRRKFRLFRKKKNAEDSGEKPERKPSGVEQLLSEEEQKVAVMQEYIRKRRAGIRAEQESRDSDAPKDSRLFRRKEKMQSTVPEAEETAASAPVSGGADTADERMEAREPVVEAYDIEDLLSEELLEPQKRSVSGKPEDPSAAEKREKPKKAPKTAKTEKSGKPSKLSKAGKTPRPGNPWFMPDESQSEDESKTALRMDDTLYAALHEMHRSADAEQQDPSDALSVNGALFSDREKPDIDIRQTQPDLPDLDAFAAAEASRDRNPYGFATTMSLTIDRTDDIDKTVDDVRSFLRADTRTYAKDEAADMEFSGIGYLFSEEDYDAIIAKIDDHLLAEGEDAPPDGKKAAVKTKKADPGRKNL